MQVWLGATAGPVGAEDVVSVGAGAMGAVRVVELPLALDVVLELLVGRFRKCPLKVIWPMLSKFSEHLMMVSILFEI